MPATQAACLQQTIRGERIDLGGLAEGEELKTNLLHVERRFLAYSSDRPGCDAYCGRD